MSMPIDLQLRGYTEFFETQMRVVDLDEIMERHLGEEPVRPIGATTMPQNFRPRREWVVAVASAAAVLILIGGTALLMRTIGSDTSIATSPPIDSVSSPTWSRVTEDEAVFGGRFEQSMFDVTAGGPGLVAVGSAGSDAAVWTSPDGVTWSRDAHNEAIFGGKASYGINSVTAAGPGLVAVGGSSFGQEDGQGAVWTSPDGVTWSRVPHNEAVFVGRPQVGMGSITVGGPGLVAVGESGWERDFDAAVWNARVED